jgi:hypothetical protein
VDVFDIVIRHIEERGRDRFSMIPISAIKTVSEIGSMEAAIDKVRSDQVKKNQPSDQFENARTKKMS